MIGKRLAEWSHKKERVIYYSIDDSVVLIYRAERKVKCSGRP